MKKYEIIFEYRYDYLYEVEADSEEKAYDIAEKMLDSGQTPTSKNFDGWDYCSSREIE
jgi:hypothetical protein